MSRFRLVDDSLFFDEIDAARSGGGIHLAGGVCGECATTTFPMQESCPKCGGMRMERVPLPDEGTLWAFTVQGFEPKSPYRSTGPFTPYGVGYIDLGAVLVESRLVENDPEQLRIGDAMRARLIPAFSEEDNTQVMTFAFGRVAEGGGTDER